MNSNRIKIILRKLYFKSTIKISEKYISKIRRKVLKNNNFTIISNNCWAGWVYRRYNLPYLTPTVGLFIMPKDYIKFISNIKYYINNELKFISPEDSSYKNYISMVDKRFGTYPIGIINDIEIHFLHYKNKEEAYKKWNERIKRINYKNIIYKFNDQNGCSREDVECFKNLDIDNKIFFTSNSALKNKGIFIEEFEEKGYCVDDMLFCTKNLNLTNYLNSIKGESYEK